MGFTSEDLRKMVVALEMGAATLEKHKLYSFSIKAREYSNLALKLDYIVGNSIGPGDPFTIINTRALELQKSKQQRSESAIKYIVSNIPGINIESVGDAGLAVVEYIKQLRKAVEKGTKKTKKK